MAADSTMASHKDTYILARGGLASARLTHQHFVLTRRQGWLLHPDISAYLTATAKDNLQVADLGTGNGIWAIDVAREFPTANITGSDISAEQFPPKFTMPSNVHLELYNVLDPVPERYQSFFDVIHIRLILPGVYNQDKDLLMKNLMQMLKPGGWIQWEETIHNAYVSVDETLKTQSPTPPFLSRIDKVARVLAGLEWASRLPEHLKRAGFEHVQGCTPRIDPTLLPYETNLRMWTNSEVIDFLAKLPKPGAAEEMAQAAQDLQEDTQKGGMWTYDWLVVLAQRPAA